MIGKLLVSPSNFVSNSASIKKTIDIVSICEKYWDKEKGNCSGFVVLVAAECGVFLKAPANSIVDQIQAAPWKVLKDGVEAEQRAKAGDLVVAGLKAAPNGHVVIIVPGELNRGKYPRAYWGTLDAVGKKNETINWAWGKQSLDKVIYCARVIG